MRSEGKLYVCDRCGASAFFKKVGVESLSGGFEQYDKYEPTGDWHMEDGRDLCPVCWKEFKNIKQMFFTKVERGDNQDEPDNS